MGDPGARGGQSEVVMLQEHLASGKCSGFPFLSHTFPHLLNKYLLPQSLQFDNRGRINSEGSTIEEEKMPPFSDCWLGASPKPCALRTFFSFKLLLTPLGWVLLPFFRGRS